MVSFIQGVLQDTSFLLTLKSNLRGVILRETREAGSSSSPALWLNFVKWDGKT